jgi:hypothetical protein
LRGGCKFAGAAVASWEGFFFHDNLLCFCKDAATMGAGAAAAAMGMSIASTARTAWHFGWGVAHIVQNFPPLLG